MPKKCQPLGEKYGLVSYKLHRLLYIGIWLLVCAAPLQAQYTFGINWNIPVSESQAVNELHDFHDSGISVLEIKEDTSPAVWKAISRLNFTIYGNLNIRFPLPRTFADPDSSLIKHIQSHASAFLSHRPVKALGLFEYGAFYDPHFKKSAIRFAKQLKSADKIDVYYKSASLYDRKIWPSAILLRKLSQNSATHSPFPLYANILAVEYPNDSIPPGNLSAFKEFLKNHSESADFPILLKQSWYDAAVSGNPQFKSTLYSLAKNRQAVFPVHEEKESGANSIAFPVVILLICWGAIALFYNSNPIYRKSIFRYFTAHKFFINDIFKRHFRCPLCALFILSVNTLLVSTGFYTAFNALLTPLGKQSLLYHFPILSIGGSVSVTVFWGLLIALALLTIICIIWMLIAHRQLKTITQAATIYAWPLQINFIIATIAITIISAGGSIYVAMLLALAAVLITLISFIIACVNSAGFLRKGKASYLLWTAALYLIISGGFIFAVLSYSNLWQVLKLSLYIK